MGKTRGLKTLYVAIILLLVIQYSVYYLVDCLRLIITPFSNTPWGACNHFIPEVLVIVLIGYLATIRKFPIRAILLLAFILALSTFILSCSLFITFLFLSFYFLGLWIGEKKHD